MNNEESVYCCACCTKSFTQKKLLKRHIDRVHNKLKTIQCNICAKSFYGKGDLDQHKKSHSGERPFPCDHCDKSFSYLTTAKRHRRLIHNMCEICDKAAKNQDALKEHMKAKHGPDSLFTCDKCPKSFYEHYKLKKHEIEHNGSKPYTCEICTQIFKSKDEMITHEIISHQKYVNSDCLQHELSSIEDKDGNKVETSRNESEIKVTMNIKIKQEYCDKENLKNASQTREEMQCLPSSYFCIYCHKDFMRKRDMKMHIVFKHTQARPFGCDLCEKRFKTRKCVYLHLRTHGDREYNWCCKICGKSFYSISGYHTHLKVHSNVREFECEDCGKSFKFKHQLKRHKLIHNPESGYTCDICGKKFNRSDSLTNHKRRHTGENAYKRGLLIKNAQSELFNTTNTIYKGTTLQKRVNIEKKQFSCDINDFSSKDDVNEHIKTHTDEKSCQCSVCDKLFDNDSLMISHMKVKCGKIKPVSIRLKKLFIRSMNPVEGNSGPSEINNVDNTVDAITAKGEGHTTSHTSNIPNTNVISSENTDSVRANQETFTNDITLDMDMDYVLVKSEVNIDPIDAELDMDNDNILFKSEIIHKRVDNITGIVEGHNGNISEVNVDSHENIDFIEANNENSTEEVDNNDILIKSKDIKSECSVSDKSCTYKKTHTEDKPFACSVCSKSFTQGEHFRKHMRMHTGEKPFSCSLCEKSFKLKQTLKTHLRTHTGEKPFKCTVCCKAFNHNVSLKTHMRKHTEEKPLGCRNDLFRKDNLNEVVNAHCDKESYQCSVCHKLFDDNIHMKRHVKAKCSKIKPVFVVLKKLYIRLVNPAIDNSSNSEIDTDERAEDSTGNVEGHTTNIPDINVNSCENTKSVKATWEYSAKDVTVNMDNVQVKSEVIDPIDSEVDMDNDNILFKSETILNPIYEEVKTEDLVKDFVKTELEDYYEEDIIDIVDHRID